MGNSSIQAPEHARHAEKGLIRTSLRPDAAERSFPPGKIVEKIPCDEVKIFLPGGKIRDKLCSYDEYLAWRAEQNAQA